MRAQGRTVTRYLIDFDSTLVAAETLDVWAEVSLTHASDRDTRMAEVQALTERAMSGELGFDEALRGRLALLDVRREHLPEVTQRVGAALTDSARRHAGFLASDQVQIVSGGFEEVIGPVLAPLGVRPAQIHANRFLWDGDGRAIGVDPASPLAHDRGKIAVARALGGEAVMVGDGWTDLEVWASGAAARFYAYTGVVARPAVLARAERTASTLDDLLRQEAVAA
jgi:D-3-phosphoglycerate dehydrogenase